MTMANFPNMQQLDGLNFSGFVINTAIPPGFGPATRDPVGTKRFNGIRIDVLSTTFRVFFHKRQSQADDPESVWMVELPKQYSGAFQSLHIGTPTCTPSPFVFFVDPVGTIGGLFTDSMTPSGSCCQNNGECGQVNSAGECTNGTFRMWGTCFDPGFLCCPEPWADSDGDADVDFDDFGAFQACFTGPGGGVTPDCACMDKVTGGSAGVDDLDFEAFKACVTGPSVPLDLNSLPPGCSP
jgi:hypothetical protein